MKAEKRTVGKGVEDKEGKGKKNREKERKVQNQIQTHLIYLQTSHIEISTWLKIIQVFLKNFQRNFKNYLKKNKAFKSYVFLFRK